MTDVRLSGCAPAPLAHYLKALGILRLVAEQADPAARGWWEGDEFVLRSKLDAEHLIRFFTDEVCPTPVVGPWSGGCGFFPGDSQAGIGPISQSDSPRFRAYVETITVAKAILAQRGITAKPDPKEKGTLIEALRAGLPDAAVQWVDTALALTDEGPKFPPLLGTGGNDGRLDFTNNLMQRWVELLLTEPRPPRAWLRNALFGEAAADLSRGSAIGQFHPAGAGGANLTAGFDRDSLVNAWNFVLMLEGALMFASAVTRRLEGARPGALVYPFTVRSAGAGYASASASDEADARNEIWLPLWGRPTSLPELKSLFAEGRARVRSGLGHRPADTAVDFARSIQELGVQRGVSAFTRFGFHKRNGLSYLAVPLGRWRVRRNQGVDLLAPLDEWLHRFRRGATGKLAPASVRRALSRLEDAMLALCAAENCQNVQAVLAALGQAEHSLATSMKFTAESYQTPVVGLSAEWLTRADDGSVAWRLAAALGSAGLRDHLVPVRAGRWAEHDDGRTVWGEGNLTSNLIAVARRRELDRGRAAPPSEPPVFADLADVTAYIEGAVDETRLVELLRGAALIDWRGVRPHTAAAASVVAPPYAFAACALAWGGAVATTHHRSDDVVLPPASGVLARLVAGDVRGSVASAHRRLHGSGLALRVGLDTAVAASPAAARRIAAALVFPLSHASRRALAAHVLNLDSQPLENP
jgi:CRISPR-associated protein Csx17